MLNLHLQAIVEARNRAAHFDNVSAFEFFRDARVRRIPDAAFNLPRLVSQDQIQIRLVRLGGSLLLVQHQKKRVEVLALFEPRQIGDIDVLHAAGKHTAISTALPKRQPRIA